MSSVVRDTLAIIPACSQNFVLYPEDPRRDSISNQQVVCLVCCSSHSAVDPSLQIVFLIVLWHAVEGKVAVSVVVASFLLVRVLWADLHRVFLRFVVWFVRGRRRQLRRRSRHAQLRNFWGFSVRLYDHPHHPSLCGLEFLLLLGDRSRA